MNQRNLCAAVLTLITFASVGLAQWKILNPDSVQHPGAKEAPASDPRTYPDKAGFEKRSKLIIAGLATNDLQTWRKGYFTGGDPGKYTFGPAMAKLILNPQAEDAIKIQNEERSLKEQYHFACVNWSRFLPIFGSILTEQSQQTLAAAVGKYGYLDQGGTENHKVMWMTSANVLPWYTATGRLQNMGKEEALKRAKEALRTYVKGLYAAGQGEWDSSTYLMFDVNGMLNVYDFSKDEECRLMAKAALDWYAAGYALKYTDGVYCAPNQRGFAHAYAEKIADNTGWLWWGGSQELTAEQTRRFLYAMHPITSSWRPNQVISSIATRKLPQLPFEQRSGKPNYWYGARQEPQANVMQESLYVAKEYTMGSLWKGFGSQLTRFQIVARGEKGPVVFTGGHPAHFDNNLKRDGLGYEDGIGGYDQSAQFGQTHITLIKIPQAEELGYCFFSIPEEAGKPQPKGNWFIWQVGKALIGVQPLSPAKTADSDPVGKDKKTHPILRIEGRSTGFIVETADTSAYATIDAFATALSAAKLDASKYDSAGELTYAGLGAKAIALKYQDGQGRLKASLDGKEVSFADWPIYSGPYLNHKPGVLSVNDGREGFTIEFTGDLPVYKAWAR